MKTVNLQCKETEINTTASFEDRQDNTGVSFNPSFKENKPTTIYASVDDSPDDICERIGIITTNLSGNKATWMYKGKVYPRPDYVNNFEDKMLEYFNITIVYQDKNQLSIF